MEAARQFILADLTFELENVYKVTVLHKDIHSVKQHPHVCMDTTERDGDGHLPPRSLMANNNITNACK